MPGVVESLGASPAQRRKLFFLVCVPLRLLLAVLVSRNLSSSLFLRTAIMASSAMSIYVNMMGSLSSNRVWWSQEVHLLSSALVLGGTFFNHFKLVEAVMFSDVLFGVIAAMLRDPW